MQGIPAQQDTDMDHVLGFILLEPANEKGAGGALLPSPSHTQGFPCHPAETALQDRHTGRYCHGNAPVPPVVARA